MRRLFLLFFCVLSVAAATLDGPSVGGGIAFVVNSGGASISVIDMATQKEVRRIPTLREPHHLVLSPDGRSLLVGDTAGNQMMFLDPNTGEVQKRMPVADPYQLGFSPDGKFLVVNGLARNQVDVYDAAHDEAAEAVPGRRDTEPPGLFAGFVDGLRQPAGQRQAGGVRPAHA